MDGGVVSLMFTVRLTAGETLPAASRAVYVSVYVPLRVMSTEPTTVTGAFGEHVSVAVAPRSLYAVGAHSRF